MPITSLRAAVALLAVAAAVSALRRSAVAALRRSVATLSVATLRGVVSAPVRVDPVSSSSDGEEGEGQTAAVVDRPSLC